MGEVMTSKYVPGRIKPRHPALSDPKELERVFKRYNGSARLASMSMGCSETTVTKAIRELRPDLYEALVAQGKARGPKVGPL